MSFETQNAFLKGLILSKLARPQEFSMREIEELWKNIKVKNVITAKEVCMMNVKNCLLVNVLGVKEILGLLPRSSMKKILCFLELHKWRMTEIPLLWFCDWCYKTKEEMYY